MTIFLLLLGNLFPLYIIIAIGYIAGRCWEVDRVTLSSLALFILQPVTVFGFIVNIDLQLSYIALPLVIIIIRTILLIAGLKLGDVIYKDRRANLLSICATMSNMGYMGLPLMIMMFPPHLVALYAFMLLGGTMFEATGSYYVAARGNYSIRDSVDKLLKFPTLYAIIGGLVVNMLNVNLSDQFFTFWEYFKGGYVVVGMMIIGASLPRLSQLVISPKFLSLVFMFQFVMWPALAYMMVVIDREFLHLFDGDIHRMLMVASLLPPAANITAFATQMDLKPEKAATTVLISTIFALFYIPAMLVVLGLG